MTSTRRPTVFATPSSTSPLRDADTLGAVHSEIATNQWSRRCCDSRIFPLGSAGSRRAIVRWSDGSESEALTFYADEILFCEGDLLGKTQSQIHVAPLPTRPRLAPVLGGGFCRGGAAIVWNRLPLGLSGCRSRGCFSRIARVGTTELRGRGGAYVLMRRHRRDGTTGWPSSRESRDCVRGLAASRFGGSVGIAGGDLAAQGEHNVAKEPPTSKQRFSSSSHGLS